MCAFVCVNVRQKERGDMRERVGEEERDKQTEKIKEKEQAKERKSTKDSYLKVTTKAIQQFTPNYL